MPHISSQPAAVVVGSGYIANRHVAALRAANIPVLGVYSATPGNSARAARNWGTTAVADVSALLDLPHATHVHICTPTTSHDAFVNEALDRELAVVCEKPLTTSGRIARTLADRAGSLGVENFVTFNRRHDGGIQLFRSLYASGEVGTAVGVYGLYQQEWNAPISSKDWRFDPSQVGPSRVVSEIGSHWLDLAEFVTGLRITEVASATANMGEREFLQDGTRGRFTPTNEDTFSSLLRFSNGALGTVMATQLAHGAWDDIGLRVDGTTGSLYWDSSAPGRVALSRKGQGTTILGVGGPTTSIETMIEAIYHDGGGSCATFFDGLRNCMVQDAVLESAADHRWTSVRDYS